MDADIDSLLRVCSYYNLLIIEFISLHDSISIPQLYPEVTLTPLFHQGIFYN